MTDVGSLAAGALPFNSSKSYCAYTKLCLILVSHHAYCIKST